MKYTKTKWKIKFLSNQGTPSIMSRTTDGSDSIYIAEIQLPNNDDGLRDWESSKEIMMGNAKLISKASEMYEALKSLQDIAHNGGADGNGQDIHKDMFKTLCDKLLKQIEK